MSQDEYAGAGTVAELIAELRQMIEAGPVTAGYRVALAGCDCYGPWERSSAHADETDRTVALERKDSRLWVPMRSTSSGALSLTPWRGSIRCGFPTSCSRSSGP